MSDAAFVEEARGWAKALVRAECRFPGDYAAAMARLARRIGVPSGLLTDLHYRPPKRVSVSQYVTLAGAYVDAQRRYRVERDAAAPKTALGRALLGVADRLDQASARLAGEGDGALR